MDIFETYRNNTNNEVVKDYKGNIIININREDFTRPVARVWVGNRAKKPRYQYSFNTLADRETWIEKQKEYYIRKYNEKIIQKQKVQKTRKKYTVNAKVGDIFHASFGYNMILNEFYKILSIKGHKVVIQKLQNKIVKDRSYLCWEVVPSDSLVGEPMEKRIMVDFRCNKPTEYIKIDYGRAYNVTEQVKNGETWLQDELD